MVFPTYEKIFPQHIVINPVTLIRAATAGQDEPLDQSSSGNGQKFLDLVSKSK